MSSRRNRIKAVVNIPLLRKSDSLSTNESVKLNSESSTNDHSVEQSDVSHKTVENDEVIIEPVNSIPNVTNDVPNPIIVSAKPFATPFVATTPPKPKRIQLADRTSYSTPNVNNGPSPIPEKNYDKEKFLNRTRIKPVPNLDGRRVHGSASESEDDVRRNINRIRTLSVSNTMSGTNDSDTVHPLPRIRQYSTVIQRKCRRSEQSRKMAEARREFTLKFGNDMPPEKSKLTMMDLIFYNPTTNPMSKKTARTNSESNRKSQSIEVDPRKNEDEKAEANENSSLVPQIKVGPDGNIILDEHSLIIDSSKQKSSGKTAVTELIDGNYENSYGIYKKAKRSKDWSNAETVRFYRALNTIGTDFSIMTDVFPNRDRRELKMKFKKEERVNQHLVDKALKSPVAFDLVGLKADIEKEDKEKQEELEREEERKAERKRKQEARRQISNASKLMRKRKQRSNVSSSDDEFEKCSRFASTAAQDEYYRKKTKELREMRHQKQLERMAATALAGLNKLNNDEQTLDVEMNESPSYSEEGVLTSRKDVTCETNGDDVLNAENNSRPGRKRLVTYYSSSDDEMDSISQIKLRPTRSGRIPKQKQLDMLPTSSLHVVSDGTSCSLADDLDDDQGQPIVKIVVPPSKKLTAKLKKILPKPNGTQPSHKVSKFKQNMRVPPAEVPKLLPHGINQVPNGTLLVVSTKDPNGQLVHKVYMVTPGTKVETDTAPSEDNSQELADSLGPAVHITIPNNVEQQQQQQQVEQQDENVCVDINHALVKTTDISTPKSTEVNTVKDVIGNNLDANENINTNGSDLSIRNIKKRNVASVDSTNINILEERMRNNIIYNLNKATVQSGVSKLANGTKVNAPTRFPFNNSSNGNNFVKSSNVVVQHAEEIGNTSIASKLSQSSIFQDDLFDKSSESNILNTDNNDNASSAVVNEKVINNQAIFNGNDSAFHSTNSNIVQDSSNSNMLDAVYENDFSNKYNFDIIANSTENYSSTECNKKQLDDSPHDYAVPEAINFVTINECDDNDII